MNEGLSVQGANVGGFSMSMSVNTWPAHMALDKWPNETGTE